MSSSWRTSAPRSLTLAARGLGAVAILAAAGCSADVTRFSLLGGAAQPPAAPMAYAPPERGWSGQGYPTAAIPPSSLQQQRPEQMARVPEYAPPWKDGDPLPWPDGAAEKRRPPPAAVQPAGWQGRHLMKSGESLYTIAQRHKVSVEELKRVNGIADATKVWAGKVLLVPDRPGAPAGPAAAPRVVQAAPAPTEAAPEAPEQSSPAPARPAVRRMARLNDGKASDALPAPAVAGGRFRWPARGKVIVPFGAQTEGGKSEGINLAVPLGTDIHAAESGRVHYVGDGVKGYGNLILIRHANDWVTAYAHADQILVKANDEVKRGQVIGRAGRTGPVAQPQLHFELRNGSVPVDPLPHLAN